MPKFFVTSDTHGFYDEMIKALNEAGFNKDNPEHVFVHLGDYTDRGAQPKEILDYVSSLKNKILIWGNHESLLEKCIQRGFPYDHDFSNGTAGTIIKIGLNKDIDEYYFPTPKEFKKACDVCYPVFEEFKKQLVPYFESQNYIFCHSFIPLIGDYRKSNVYKEDWRDSNFSEWESAMWGNPFDLAQDGLNQTGKIIVHGHYHNSLGWVYKTHGALSEFGEDAKFDICEHNNCIGLDSCCAFSKKINCLIIEEETLW